MTLYERLNRYAPPAAYRDILEDAQVLSVEADRHNICVVDHKNKRFKVGYVKSPDFLENINYTFHPEVDIDDYIERYYCYYQDESIDFSKYIGTAK